MNAAFVIGRIALVVIFVFSGVAKLLDIPGTADMIQGKLVIPAQLSDLKTQIETAVSMSIWQILAILAGVIEAGCGLLIAFGILTRTAAVVLLLFTLVVTFYFHDFWNMTGPDRTNNMIIALKNLSIIGAFLMIAAWPRRVVVAEVAPSADRLEPL
jgi:putative oxidoreductase